MSTMWRTTALLTLAAVAALTVACQPTSVALTVSNESGIDIDIVYAEDFIDLREFGRDYGSLRVGDTDTYAGCTECNVGPGEVYTLETPLSQRQSVVLAARAADTERLIFIQRYTYEELRALEWTVAVVDMSGNGG